MKVVAATATNTAWKVSKYKVFSGPYFPVFGLNTGKYGLEKTLYLDTIHAELLHNTYFLHEQQLLKSNSDFWFLNNPELQIK